MLAVVAPGQGSQTPGFLAPWAELPGVAERLAALSAATGLDLRELGTSAGADTIRDTAVAQPLLVGAGLAALPEVLPDVEAAAVVAGHSVGEVTALAATGVLSADEAGRLVAVRATAMARAAARTATGMTAVLGGDPDEVVAAAAAAGVVVANANGAGQVVVAGTTEQLAAFAAAPPAKARVVPLAVAGAFHTEHMAPAVAALAEHAAALQPGRPRTALLSNRDGEVVEDGRDALDRLVAQVARPVRWDLCLERMAALGVTGLLELPPAGTLAGIAKRALPGVEVVALKSPDDLDRARALVAAHAGVAQ
ncbi:[acyl-carrier-protein] S-malonyltransferase [Motilibacter rhizosphaerae]|uniref:[acyl-carrier-protein] S-malonyltransferase n=1 Tax=Motilibacter rhizosphaerae TaxID=598652 RepID=A0A4Q7NSB7_9ACTN|nr:ACP S-malonyltransferase [Motilibacter rhizosphaerae]RZS89668.1 [acyl-carrier-protein] S-malonyltransferase [Motilibacter rhizosphaerae]